MSSSPEENENQTELALSPLPEEESSAIADNGALPEECEDTGTGSPKASAIKDTKAAESSVDEDVETQSESLDKPTPEVSTVSTMTSSVKQSVPGPDVEDPDSTPPPKKQTSNNKENENDKNEKQEQQQGRRRSMIVFAIVAIVIVLGLVLGLSIGLTRRSSSSAALTGGEVGVNSTVTNPPTVFVSSPFPSVSPSLLSLPPSLSPVASPTQVPIPLEPTISPTTFSPTTALSTLVLARREAGRTYLISNGIATAAVLDDSQSYQNFALSFVATSIDVIPTMTGREFVERYAVMCLYYALSGPIWNFQWGIANAGTPTCQWNEAVPNGIGGAIPGGIFCLTDSDARIQGIQLIQTGLAGSLPSELGLLTDLEIIRLNQNNVVGSLPSELQNLNKLVNLNLDFNSVRGPLPEWIGEFTDITTLSFSNNMLEGQLPDALATLTNIASISVDDNLMVGNLQNMEPLSQMSELFAEDNSFDGSLEFLTNMPNVRFMDLSNNRLTGTLPGVIVNYVNLTILDLHGNALTGEFPEVDTLNNNLRLLALQRNDFSGQIPDSISGLVALTHLDLTTTLFTGDMPEAIGELTNLVYLFMADTTFDLGPIPELYFQLTFLRDFSLKDSGRTGTIPTWIGTLDRLWLLDLDSNQFTGSIPSEIGNMPSVRFLLFNRNRLTGTIPSQLSNIGTVLRAALFDHNELSGDATLACLGLPTVTLVTSDCNTTGAPEGSSIVTCPCCRVCCAPGDDSCNDFDNLAQFDPVWEDNYRRPGYDFGVDYNITRI